jgi:hypothetical protein
MQSGKLNIEEPNEIGSIEADAEYGEELEVNS